MSKLSAEKSQEAITSVLAVAFGTIGIVFVVEFFHIPDAYIALSLAASLSLLPRPTFRNFILRIACVTLGISCGVFLIVTLPQSPWIYFFFIGFITATGYHLVLKHVGTGAAYLFSAYFAAMSVKAITKIFSSDLVIVVVGLELLAQAISAIVITYVVALILRKKSVDSNSSSFRSPISSMTSITIVVWIAILVAFSHKTDQSARLIIASISGITALETESSTESFRKRMLGYILGAIFSISFIVAIVASTNDLAIYLFGLGFLFGLLEWLANYYSSHKILFRAITMMFAYSALMLPSPDSNLQVSMSRVVASLIGFTIYILVFSVMVEAQKITRFMISPKSVID